MWPCGTLAVPGKPSILIFMNNSPECRVWMVELLGPLGGMPVGSHPPVQPD